MSALDMIVRIYQIRYAKSISVCEFFNFNLYCCFQKQHSIHNQRFNAACSELALDLWQN